MVCDLAQFRLPLGRLGLWREVGEGGSWGGGWERDPNVVIINVKRPMFWIKGLNEN